LDRRRNIYTGSLSLETTEDQLRRAFEGFGEVSSFKIAADRNTAKPGGFAFVGMSIKDEATRAISCLNGIELDGRNLRVGEANLCKESGHRRSY